MKRYIRGGSDWLHMHEDDVAELIAEINELDEWDSDQVDSLIQYAMEANSAFESDWQWAFDCKENCFDAMGNWDSDDEDLRYDYMNIDWEDLTYQAADILGYEYKSGQFVPKA